jgi:hypothetical protein
MPKESNLGGITGGGASRGIPKGYTTGMKKAERLVFNNTDKISQQGNKQKISGSVRSLKKSIKKKSK